jgi:hypothetical protein
MNNVQSTWKDLTPREPRINIVKRPSSVRPFRHPRPSDNDASLIKAAKDLIDQIKQRLIDIPSGSPVAPLSNSHSNVQQRLSPIPSRNRILIRSSTSDHDFLLPNPRMQVPNLIDARLPFVHHLLTPMLIDVTKQMGNEIRKSAIPLELPGVGLQDC